MAPLRVSPLDVVLSRIRVGEVSNPRPCVVLEVDANDMVSLMPCSTSFDLYRHVQDFPIYEDDPDFAATGLSRSSYVIGEGVDQVHISQVRKRYGRLTGDLASGFRTWAGI